MRDDGRLLALGAVALVGAASAVTAVRGSRAVKAEQLALRCAESAAPGIKSLLAPGEIVLYRTSRVLAEAEAICAALDRGEPHEAFRASERIHPQLTGHGQAYARRLERARRRGARPLFTTPYPSTAYIYRRFAASDPATWALIVPESAVIWTNTRTYETQGVFYSLTYVDAEVVIDATKVRRVLHLPAALIDALGAAVEDLAKANIVRGSHKGSYRDRDPALAEAARRAVTDLRLPPERLGRPFVEEPMATSGGAVRKGDRVLLRDGQVVRLKGYRALSSHLPPQIRDGMWRGQPGSFSVSGLREWLVSYVHLSSEGLTADLFERVLAPGERVSKAERLATWRRNLGFLAELLEGERSRLEAALAQGRSDERLRAAATAWIERDLALLAGDPPWLAGKASEQAALAIRHAR